MEAADRAFTLECFHNEFLAVGGTDVDAILTISHEGATPTPAQTSNASEVIIVDTSGSMTGTKIKEARMATAVAVDGIRDGASFAIVAGNHEATPVYPASGLAVANRHSREEAVKAVKRLKAVGGTAMSEWVRAATALLQGRPGVRHAILLTDGRNESEEPEELDAALDAAAGVFQCDCRGVGDGWDVAELRKVATALLGTVDIVADPGHLAADFDDMVRTAMGKSLADVALRVWTPKGTEISFVKQVAPEILDLTGSRVSRDEQSGEYPTGAWGNESRDYHLGIRVASQAVGEEMLAARVSAVVDGEVSGQHLIRVTWTDETALSTRINRKVTDYTGQQELAEAIQEGLEARREGDEDTARVRLGRAVQLAAAADNQEKLELLSRVVDVEDAVTGRVRLKASVPAEDEMTLDTRSTKTARVRR